MIIVIRGTNGSGKSHCVREVLSKKIDLMRTLAHESQLIQLPKVKRPVLVIGPYTDGRSMGGADCIRRPSEIYDLVERAIEREWHVIVEGVVLATKPWIDYNDNGVDVRYALFDPTFESCVQRIHKRQKIKGHASSFSKISMQSKLNRARKMYDVAQLHGMVTKRFHLSPVNATMWILQQLRSP